MIESHPSLNAALDEVKAAIETPAIETKKPRLSRRQRQALDPVKRAEQKQKDARAAKHSAKVQPAARELKKAKAAKPENASVAEIKSAAGALGLITKEWNGGDSFVTKLPSVGAFLKALPDKGATNEARLFIHLHKTIANFTKGDAKATWVFHKSGSFALYGELA